MTLFKYLHIGGLCAMGFDSSGKFLLVVSHSGRGLYDTQTWEKIDRDYEIVYPKPDYLFVQGIGEINHQLIPVVDRLYLQNEMILMTWDGQYQLNGDSDGISIFNIT